MKYATIAGVHPELKGKKIEGKKMDRQEKHLPETSAASLWFPGVRIPLSSLRFQPHIFASNLFAYSHAD